jgi:hypothetical protein
MIGVYFCVYVDQRCQGSWQRIILWCASVVSFTTDMGTEGGFASIPKVKVTKLCPFFQDAPEVQAEVNDGGRADSDLLDVVDDESENAAAGAACPPAAGAGRAAAPHAPGAHPAACPHDGPPPGNGRQGPAVQDITLDQLFPNACAVYGTLHIGHGATERLTDAMDHFDDWFKFFERVIKFFNHRPSRQTFLF